MKSTETVRLKDNSATRIISEARAQKRCSENGRLAVLVASFWLDSLG